MKKIMVSVVSVLLCSCASSQHWTGSSLTQQDFYRDNARCMAMSRNTSTPQLAYASSHTFGSGLALGYNQGATIASIAAQKQIYRQCMYGQGWHLTSTASKSHSEPEIYPPPDKGEGSAMPLER